MRGRLATGLTKACSAGRLPVPARHHPFIQPTARPNPMRKRTTGLWPSLPHLVSTRSGRDGDAEARSRSRSDQIIQSPTCGCPRSLFSRIKSAKVVLSTTSEIACRTRPQKQKKWHPPGKSQNFGRLWLTQSTGAIGPSTKSHDLANRQLICGPRQQVTSLRTSTALHETASLELV